MIIYGIIGNQDGDEPNKRLLFRSDPSVSIMSMFCISTACRNKYV